MHASACLFRWVCATHKYLISFDRNRNGKCWIIWISDRYAIWCGCFLLYHEFNHNKYVRMFLLLLCDNYSTHMHIWATWCYQHYHSRHYHRSNSSSKRMKMSFVRINDDKEAYSHESMCHVPFLPIHINSTVGNDNSSENKYKHWRIACKVARARPKYPWYWVPMNKLLDELIMARWKFYKSFALQVVALVFACLLAYNQRKTLSIPNGKQW